MGFKLLNGWFRPINPIRLEMFQRLLALSFLLYMIERYRYAYEWLTAYGFHLTTATKSWYHISPFPLLPAWAVPLFGVCLFGSTAALIVNWQSRKAIWIALACAIYVQNVDIISSFTLNKLFIVGLALIALSPRPTAYRTSDGQEIVLHSAWPLRILQCTLLIQYGTAGFCKVVHGDWLQYPDTLWTQSQGMYCTEIAAWMLRRFPKYLWSILMYASLGFEMTAPLLFLVRRLRIIGMIWGATFHLMIAATMYQLFYFSFQMMVFYVLFMDDIFLAQVKQTIAASLCGVARRCRQRLRGRQ